MIPKNLTTDARTIWHRENYARMKSDPARWVKEGERKRRSNAVLKAKRATQPKPIPRAIDADMYRAHGPWAALFAMQRAG
jgi:hypothetical protein